MGGGLFKVCSGLVVLSLFLVLRFQTKGRSQSARIFVQILTPPNRASDVETFSIHSMEYGVHGLHGRDRQNFCLQKSRMPLAGLVYFILIIGCGNFFAGCWSYSLKNGHLHVKWYAQLLKDQLNLNCHLQHFVE